MVLTWLAITGPPTHSVGGQTNNGRWTDLSSSSVVCNARICNVTHQGAARGEPVVLRPVRAPTLFYMQAIHYLG